MVGVAANERGEERTDDNDGQGSGTTRTNPGANAFIKLTGRERDVLAELVTGISLKVVASKLSISLQTVSTYLCRAKRKLGVESRNDLLAVITGHGGSSSELPLSIRRRVTSAELQICTAIVEGRSYGSLALDRGTSIRTVQNQAQSLFRKCGVGSRFELAALVLTS